MAEKKLPPIHPGEVLREEFLGPMGVSQYRLAQCIKVSARRINEIVHEKRAMSADTALRLGQFFGTSAEFWVNLQAHYDLEAQRIKLGPQLEKEVVTYGYALRSTLRDGPASVDVADRAPRGRVHAAQLATSRKVAKHR